MSNYGQAIAMVKIDSLSDYFDMVLDLVTLGVHEPNSWATPDQNDLSISDSFCTIDMDSGSKYLGVIDRTSKVLDEDGYSYYDSSSETPKRSNLVIDPDCKYPVPEDKDFPIVFFMFYANDFDRSGESKCRIFHWESLQTIPSSKSFREKHSLWQNTYAKEYERLCRLQEEQWRRDETNTMA